MIKKSTKPLSLLDVFSNLDEHLKQILANIESPLVLGLSTLVIAEKNNWTGYMSAEHIVAALEAAGVAVKKIQILRSFARAGTKINNKIIDGEKHYKIMTQGRNEVLPLLEKGALEVFYIESGKPRTARKALAEVLSTINGEVYICDPYYGIKSLDTLEMINKNCKVKFLTGRTNENLIKFNSTLMDFKRERPNTEIRIYSNPAVLHDRYILYSDYLFILGHGIKDIGNKESFIIKIDTGYAKDLIGNIKVMFASKWKNSTPL